MPAFVEESGMVASVDRIGVLVRSVGSDVVSLAGRADVSVEDHLAVHGDGDTVPYGADLSVFQVPSSPNTTCFCAGMMPYTEPCCW